MSHRVCVCLGPPLMRWSNGRPCPSPRPWNEPEEPQTRWQPALDPMAKPPPIEGAMLSTRTAITSGASIRLLHSKPIPCPESATYRIGWGGGGGVLKYCPPWILWMCTGRYPCTPRISQKRFLPSYLACISSWWCLSVSTGLRPCSSESWTKPSGEYKTAPWLISMVS